MSYIGGPLPGQEKTEEEQEESLNKALSTGKKIAGALIPDLTDPRETAEYFTDLVSDIKLTRSPIKGAGVFAGKRLMADLPVVRRAVDAGQEIAKPIIKKAQDFLNKDYFEPVYDSIGVQPRNLLSESANTRLTNQPLVSDVFASTSVPNYPALKPHRSFKTTSKLKTLDDYKDTWRNWPDKTKVGRDKFYKKHGMWITDEGFKMKPDALRQSPADKAENIKRFGNEMNIRSDKGVWTRKQRGDILTYMSGETPVSTKAASYKDPVTGANIIPHHRTSHGELAPWTDVIIDKLNSADPLIKAEGKEMLEIGKDIFKKFNIKVGDTLKNYEGYFHEAHLGPNSIHDLLTQHKITGPSSRSAFDFTKGQNALSKGIKVGDKTIPTTEYIRNLPWKREQVFKYRKNIIAEGKGSGKYIKGGEPITEANTFWNTLIEYIQTSNQPRQVAREEVLETFGKQGKNWAKGEI